MYCVDYSTELDEQGLDDNKSFFFFLLSWVEWNKMQKKNCLTV